MSDNSSSSSSSGCGCFGCLSFILFCFVVWGLIYGITVGEHYYSISCDTTHGVRIN